MRAIKLISAAWDAFNNERKTLVRRSVLLNGLLGVIAILFVWPHWDRPYLSLVSSGLLLLVWRLVDWLNLRTLSGDQSRLDFFIFLKLLGTGFVSFVFFCGLSICFAKISYWIAIHEWHIQNAVALIVNGLLGSIFLSITALAKCSIIAEKPFFRGAFVRMFRKNFMLLLFTGGAYLVFYIPSLIQYVVLSEHFYKIVNPVPEFAHLRLLGSVWVIIFSVTRALTPAVDIALYRAVSVPN